MKKIILILGFLVFGAQAQAVTYNVSKSGSNANSCATAQSGGTSAKLTIVAGLSCLASGDTLQVDDGTYDEGFVRLGPDMPSGSSGNLTTLKSLNSRGAILDFSNPDDAILGLNNGQHHIRFEGFVIDQTNNTGAGIFFDNLSTDGEIIDIEIKNHLVQQSNQVGMFVAGDGHRIARTYVHDIGLTPIGSLGAHCMYLAGTNMIIEDNVVEDCVGYGIHVYSSSGGVNNVTVRRNKAIRAHSPGILVGSGTGHRVHNNIVADTQGSGFGSILVNTGSGHVLYNNTVYGGSGRPCFELYDFSSSSTIRNTLCSETGNDAGVNNGSGNTISNTVSGAASGHFVNAGAENFALISTSTAINAGVAAIASGVTACANGSAPDVGAHETFTVAGAEVGNVNSTTVVINLNNNCTASILPASGITGLTIEEDTGGGFAAKTISGATSTAGSNQVRAVVTAAFTGGSTARFSYATGTGNITDSALIGNTNNQRLNAVTNFSITNNVSGGGGAVFSVVNLRAYEHDCGEVCTRYLSSNLTAAGKFAIPLRGKGLLRVGIKCTGADCPAQAHALWYGKNGAADTQVPTQTTGQEDLSLCPAPSVQNGDATTQQITSGTFVAGQVRTIAAGAPSVDLAENGVSENVYSICIGPSVVVTDTFTLQVRDSGGTAITNTAVATATVQNPTRANAPSNLEVAAVP